MNDDYGSYKNNGVMGYNQEDAFLGSKEYEALVLMVLRTGSQEIKSRRRTGR